MGFTNPIVAGLTLIRQAIQSSNFLTGVAGWAINRDGTAEFNDAVIRGEIIVGDESGAHVLIDVTDPPDNVPFIELYSGHAEEALPAIITNDPIPITGRIPLTLLSTDRTDSANRARVEITAGSDAFPDNTTFEVTAEATIITNSSYNVTITATDFDIDGTLTYQVVTNLLNVFGKMELIAGFEVPCRIGTTEDITASGAITTTETTVLTVSASLDTGNTYRVKAFLLVEQSVSTDEFLCRIRETNASGTILNTMRVRNNSVSSLFGYNIEVEFTPGSDGTQVFVVTLIRSTGTGNIIMNGSSTQKNYAYVDYVRN
jgi:hypothetical protein